VLRRVLLAASASEQIRRVVTATPLARAIVARYVAGDTTGDAVRVARQLRGEGLLVTLDYLGEDATDGARAGAVVEEYIQLLGKLSAEGLTDGGAVEISVKPTAAGLHLPDGERTAAGNIARICAAARAAGTTVTIDAENHTAVDAAMRIAARLRGEFGDLGSVVQAALRRTEADCRALATAGTRVRLCKGAYGEPESEAYTARHDIDRSFARSLRILMEGPGFPMVATHDPRLIAITSALGLRRAPGSFEYQMLHGIRPDEQRRLAGTGARVRVYTPYGSDWYSYLVRRLAERPANLAFFLRSLRSRA